MENNDSRDYKFCLNCGAKLSKEAQFCGNCGSNQSNGSQPVYSSEPQKPAKVWEVFGLIGMILGIVSLACSVTFILSSVGLTVGPAGIVFSCLGKKGQENYGKAKVGFILSLIGTILGFIFWIILCACSGCLAAGYY